MCVGPRHTILLAFYRVRYVFVVTTCYRHNVLSQPGPEHGRVGVHPRTHAAGGHEPNRAKRIVPHSDDLRGADGDRRRVTEDARALYKINGYVCYSMSVRPKHSKHAGRRRRPATDSHTGIRSSGGAGTRPIDLDGTWIICLCHEPRCRRTTQQRVANHAPRNG